jgi:hypothetical protein
MKWSAHTLGSFSQMFVDEAQPKNALVAPPPNLETIATCVPARLPARALTKMQSYNFCTISYFFTIFKVLFAYNFTIFNLRSTAGQMPALVLLLDLSFP